MRDLGRSLGTAEFAADVLIVGGGTAGCVLAARLSENPQLRVVLIEAGRDMHPDATPSDVRDVFPGSYANPGYFWPSSQAVYREGLPPVYYPQAKTLGGGSVVMGMQAPRGLESDFDAWPEAGAPGWGFRDVLPYFKKLEHDYDFPGGDHGDDGPIPITRRPRASWPGFTEGVATALEARGLPFLPDLNGTDDDGVFELPSSNDRKLRFSSANAYLTADVRRRPNLRVFTDTEVRELAIEGRRAVGVTIAHGDGATEFIPASWVVVAAGAIFTPAMLLRSGIGPAQQLSEAGVSPLVDNPYVGTNLHNHPIVAFGATIRKPARHDPAMRSYVLGCARLSSFAEGAPPSDLFMAIASRFGPRDRDVSIGTASTALYAPFSRGAVTLARDGSPVVNLGLLSDERDKERLLIGARIARDVMESPSVRAATYESFVIPAKQPMHLLNKPGLKAGFYSIALAAGMNAGKAMRRGTISLGIGEGRLIENLGPSEFDDLVLQSAVSMGHPAGSCAIGKVVDSRTMVKGLENLFVADASIMPTVPRANTNMATVMIAEKASAEILSLISGV